VQFAKMGGIGRPRMLTIYSNATSDDALVTHIVGRGLDRKGVDPDLGQARGRTSALWPQPFTASAGLLDN